jgi:hypothetical protein
LRSILLLEEGVSSGTGFHLEPGLKSLLAFSTYYGRAATKRADATLKALSASHEQK